MTTAKNTHWKSWHNTVCPKAHLHPCLFNTGPRRGILTNETRELNQSRLFPTHAHKEILSQFEFVPRLSSRAEEIGRGNNDTDGASANSTRVLSPDTLDS